MIIFLDGTIMQVCQVHKISSTRIYQVNSTLLHMLLLSFLPSSYVKFPWFLWLCQVATFLQMSQSSCHDFVPDVMTSCSAFTSFLDNTIISATCTDNTEDFSTKQVVIGSESFNVIDSLVSVSDLTRFYLLMDGAPSVYSTLNHGICSTTLNTETPDEFVTICGLQSSQVPDTGNGKSVACITNTILSSSCHKLY